MKKLPNNYLPFILLEETLDAKHALHNFLVDELIDAFNLIHIDSPVLAHKPNIYKSGVDLTNRPINFDVSSSNEVLELFTNFDKWKIYFLFQHEIQKKYNGILTEAIYVNRDIEELTNVHSYMEEDLEIELIIDKQNYKMDHYLVYVEKLFKILGKIQEKTTEVTDKKIPTVLPSSYDIYDWKQLKKENANLSDEDILITKARQKGLIFVYNGLTCEIAHRFGWIKTPDLNHNEMQGSFLVYNSYSGEVYNIGSVFMRVDSKTMNNQIEEEKKHFLRDNKINKLTASKRIPITIGLKLHKAKLLLFLLQKCHIAEVQPSIWSEETEEKFKKHNIDFL